MRYVLKQKPQLNSDTSIISELQKQFEISALTASLLCARGIDSVDKAEAFLHPSLEQLHDPFLFEDMRDAVNTVKHMISTKSKICVYGDYDADGISASAILYKTLLKLGADVEVFLPNRMEHGYGLSLENVERLKGISLLITVDCGITAVAEIARAKELGIVVILTDHHECPHVLPQADYILDPKRPGETYPFDVLCGAGVAFKLAQALLGDAALHYLDIAALGTIADIVPLTGENRAIAALGLLRMNEQPNSGIGALCKRACNKHSTEIDAQTVSFVLAPRINAAGRISTAKVAFELLTDSDKSRLDTLAEELCTLNIDRQQRQEKVIFEALKLQEQEAATDRIIILYKKDWDIGIVGLAASKVAEQYARPTILLGETEAGVYTGSARSIAGVNIYEALNSQINLFERFGGHAAAAGVTIKEEHLPQLKHRLNEYLKEHYADDVFRPLKTYDIKITPADATAAFISELNTLKPFGCNNEQVELLIKSAKLTDIKSIGDDKHAKFQITKNGIGVNAVKFGVPAEDIPTHADIVGTLSINTFDMKPQMIVNTFSYDETLAQRLDKAKAYVKNIDAQYCDKKSYFSERDKLLEVYSVLKGISDKNISFANNSAFVSLLQKHVNDVTVEHIAFAVTVFEEIGLLSIQKNDRIHIIISTEKCDLMKSDVYKKFLGEN
ncbi:MAG: single-stranded-DNA-specific exonuclease RecJ [Christensenella sp.]